MHRSEFSRPVSGRRGRGVINDSQGRPEFPLAAYGSFQWGCSSKAADLLATAPTGSTMARAQKTTVKTTTAGARAAVPQPHGGTLSAGGGTLSNKGRRSPDGRVQSSDARAGQCGRDDCLSERVRTGQARCAGRDLGDLRPGEVQRPSGFPRPAIEVDALRMLPRTQRCPPRDSRPPPPGGGSRVSSRTA